MARSRGGRIPGVFDRRATQPGGMHRRSNATVIADPSTGPVVAGTGTRFGIRDARPRPVGRIGGIVASDRPGAGTAFSGALGPGARVLRSSPEAPGPRFVADCDHASLDGMPLAQLEEAALSHLADRLARITGASRSPGGTMRGRCGWRATRSGSAASSTPRRTVASSSPRLCLRCSMPIWLPAHSTSAPSQTTSRTPMFRAGAL